MNAMGQVGKSMKQAYLWHIRLI